MFEANMPNVRVKCQGDKKLFPCTIIEKKGKMEFFIILRFFIILDPEFVWKQQIHYDKDIQILYKLFHIPHKQTHE